MQELNNCIFGKMDETDSRQWAPLFDGLEKLINEAQETDAQQRLKQLCDYRVY